VSDTNVRGEILIVDDYPVNLRLLQELLLAENYEVRAATSGAWALSSAQANPPDLVMLDITMPEMDGYEVCRRLKADPATGDIPVIFISAHDDALDKVRAFKIGACDYVTKPFQAEEVVARIENQLQNHRLRRQLEDSRRELERQNAELRQRNDELTQAQRRTDLVFSALSDALPGTVLDGKYRLEDKIGTGGFGTIFRATHLELRRPVAVKVFRPRAGNDTPEALERFRLEGVSASRIRHPNAVAVFDSGITSSGIAYLVMELLRGCSLADELRAHRVLPLRRAAGIITQVCSALSEAHAQDIIHRDVKPENVFLHAGADGECVKVLDFGTVKMVGSTFAEGGDSLTAVGQVVGTPEYMAPERLRNAHYDGRADVYSVAVMLYRMLAGTLPFRADDPYVVAVMQLSNDPPPVREFNPNVPEAVETLIRVAMSKNPARRPTADEFARRLREAAADAPGVESPLSVEAASDPDAETDSFSIP
jgi:serine/threonine protein kinase